MYKVENDHLKCLVGNLLMKSVCQRSCAKRRRTGVIKAIKGHMFEMGRLGMSSKESVNVAQNL